MGLTPNSVPYIPFGQGGGKTGGTFGGDALLRSKIKYFQDLQKSGQYAANALKPVATGSGALVGRVLTGVTGALLWDLLAPQSVGQSEADYLLNLKRFRDKGLLNKPGTGVINNPTISRPPTYIYRDTQIVYVPMPPPRRLKPLARTPDTSPTRDIREPVVTVEESFESRQWGVILHEPIFSYPYEMKEFVTPAIEERLIDELKIKEQRFGSWLLNDEPLPITEQSIVFIDAFDFKNSEKYLEAFCGVKPIQMLYDYWLVRSKNALRPIVTMIPTSIISKEVRIPIANYARKPGNLQNSRLGLAASSIGADNFPMVVPADITDQKSGIGVLHNSAEAFAYLIKTIDALVGQFPIELEIQDSDQFTSGDQSKKIKLENLAECMAELVGMAVSTKMTEQVLTSLAVKNTVLNAQNLISSAVIQDVVKANADYLGFKQKNISRKMRLPFTPGKETFAEMLQDSEQSYESIDITDEKDLNDYLHELLQSAAIVKGALYRRVKGPNYKEQIKQQLLELYKVTKGSQDIPQDEWEQFIEDTEIGFTNTNIRDKKNPYGNNFEERPRINDAKGT